MAIKLFTTSDRNLSSIATVPGVSRRSLLVGGLALIAAPSIVRASSLMDIRGRKLSPLLEFVPCDGRELYVTDYPALFREISDRYSPHRFAGNYVPDSPNGPRLPQHWEPTIPEKFNVPDFTEGFDFGVDLYGQVRFDLSPSGELLMSVGCDETSKDKVRSRLSGGTFTAADIEAMVSGNRIKI